MSALQREVTVVLGISGTGRAEMLWRVARTELDKDESIGVLWPRAEAVRVEERETPASLHLDYWEVSGGRLRTRWPLEEGKEGRCFLVAPGDRSPVDFIEMLPHLLPVLGARLGIIATLVDCGLLCREPRLERWYDACIHFSDLVLLGRREEAGEKWVRDYQEGFRRKYLPCHVDLVNKDGRPRDAQLLFSDEARRISLYFDEIEEDPEDEEMPEVPVDPYFERNASGERSIRLPDVVGREDGNDG